MEDLARSFEPFRANTVGHDQTFRSPYGDQRIVYADWTASGRMFGPIEKMMSEEIAPFVGNTHTETSVTGTTIANLVVSQVSGGGQVCVFTQAAAHLVIDVDG